MRVISEKTYTRMKGRTRHRKSGRTCEGMLRWKGTCALFVAHALRHHRARSEVPQAFDGTHATGNHLLAAFPKLRIRNGRGEPSDARICSFVRMSQTRASRASQAGGSDLHIGCWARAKSVHGRKVSMIVPDVLVCFQVDVLAGLANDTGGTTYQGDWRDRVSFLMQAYGALQSKYSIYY